MSRRAVYLIALLLPGIMMAWVAFKNKPDKDGKKPEKDRLSYYRMGVVHLGIDSVMIEAYGSVRAKTRIDLVAQVSGEVMEAPANLVVGGKFSRGQVILRIDDKDAKLSLISARSQFVKLITNILPELKLDYPESHAKWEDYLASIHMGQPLPNLPGVDSEQERLFLVNRGILTDFYNIRAQEDRVEDYTVTAPFSGQFVNVYAQPGGVVGMGSPIASIVSTGGYEVAMAIPEGQLDVVRDVKRATFFDSKGNLLAKGIYNRSSSVIDERTQHVEVFYSLAPDINLDYSKLLDGQFVRARVETNLRQPSYRIPRRAVVKDSVNIWMSDSTLDKWPVAVGPGESDSVFVTGLQEGQNVVLEEVDKYAPGEKVIGIFK